MDLKLKGKRVLITGSTAGIGFAIAQTFYAEGADVIVNGRTAERVEHALALLRETPTPQAQGRLWGIAADLSTQEGFSTLVAEHKVVDILVNNLGIFNAKSLADIRDEDFADMFRVNVLSGARLTQHYLPQMTAAGWGRVVFIASEAGVNIPPDMIPYGVSKAAQMALARGFAETTAGTGVTINSVLPGPTYSEGINHFLADVFNGQTKPRSELEKDFIKQLRPTSLLQRFATAEEVASMVAYVASPLAAATNGAALRVEGGLLRHAF